MIRALLAAILLTVTSAAAASARQDRPCQDRPCVLSGENGGAYRIVWPEGEFDGGTLKPFVFFHGFGGTGAGVARNRAMARRLHGAGYVLVAPDGPSFVWRGKERRGWGGYRGAEARWGVDTLAYMERMVADLKRRTALRLDETVLSGFSSGGSMAWYAACYGRPAVRAIVPVAGGLRRPYPRAKGKGPARDGTVCPGGPVSVLHVHGFVDNQVPLEGRAIGGWHQGDVFEGLDIVRRTNGCRSRPKTLESKGRLWCRDWTGCASGRPVRMCLHRGGHSLPKGWLDEALAWLAQLPPR